MIGLKFLGLVNAADRINFLNATSYLQVWSVDCHVSLFDVTMVLNKHVGSVTKSNSVSPFFFFGQIRQFLSLNNYGTRGGAVAARFREPRFFITINSIADNVEIINNVER